MNKIKLMADTSYLSDFWYIINFDSFTSRSRLYDNVQLTRKKSYFRFKRVNLWQYRRQNNNNMNLTH